MEVGELGANSGQMVGGIVHPDFLFCATTKGTKRPEESLSDRQRGSLASRFATKGSSFAPTGSLATEGSSFAPTGTAREAAYNWGARFSMDLVPLIRKRLIEALCLSQSVHIVDEALLPRRFITELRQLIVASRQPIVASRKRPRSVMSSDEGNEGVGDTTEPSDATEASDASDSEAGDEDDEEVVPGTPPQTVPDAPVAPTPSIPRALLDGMQETFPFPLFLSVAERTTTPYLVRAANPSFLYRLVKAVLPHPGPEGLPFAPAFWLVVAAPVLTLPDLSAATTVLFVQPFYKWRASGSYWLTGLVRVVAADDVLLFPSQPKHFVGGVDTSNQSFEQREQWWLSYLTPNSVSSIAANEALRQILPIMDVAFATSLGARVTQEGLRVLALRTQAGASFFERTIRPLLACGHGLSPHNSWLCSLPLVGADVSPLTSDGYTDTCDCCGFRRFITNKVSLLGDAGSERADKYVGEQCATRIIRVLDITDLLFGDATRKRYRTAQALMDVSFMEPVCERLFTYLA